MLRWHLVEQQHRGESTLRQGFPRLQPVGRRRFVVREKLPAQRSVEFGIASEPDCAVLLAARVNGRTKPEIEKCCRPIREGHR